MTSGCKPVCLRLVIGVICQKSTVYCYCVSQEVRVHITGGKLTRWPGYFGMCVLILDLRFGLDHCATNEWQWEFGFVNSLCGWVETISKWVVSRADDSTCVWFSWPLCVASGNSYSGCATKWNSARKVFSGTEFIRSMNCPQSTLLALSKIWPMIMCVSVIGLGLSLSKLQWIEELVPR